MTDEPLNLRRSHDGSVAHRSDCRHAKNALGWNWAAGRDPSDVWIIATRHGTRFCKVCKPIDEKDRQFWYNMKGDLLLKHEAVALLQDAEKRLVLNTPLSFMGYDLAVITTFVPVDHGSTHGTYTTTPACWATEIVGGPPDLDGNAHYSTSRNEALLFHDEAVELAQVAGCILV
jgi:hypothetical protein